MSQTSADQFPTLPTLPGDDIRQIMWGFADRFDLQMAAQNARSVARGPVARLVAEGARNSHEWTDAKASLLAAFDEAGITSLFMDPEHGGFIEGPKNFALALAAFELAWVDAGAATCSLAGHLALSPIEERGTADQRAVYMSRCAAAQPGEDREPWRGAFCLTEPLPFVGVDTGVLSGKASVARWQDGQEPVLKIEKRGRFITNMGFANFVTAAVTSADDRIRGSFMVILEQGDPGTFDRGTPTRKLVHQLSSTRDPVFSLECPASRIIGGYSIEDGVIVPNHSHAAVIAAVFSRTRVTVGVMTAAKLLSAVEPIIRYQRGRFRGGETVKPGTPRHDLGLQMKEDVRHRLVDVWATGEAAASLAFAAARLFDEFGKLFQAGHALNTWRALRYFGLLPHLLPFTAEWLGDDVDGPRTGFIEAALRNTDKRVADDQPVTPMFLLAVFLWGPVRERADYFKEHEEMSEVQSLVAAGAELSAAQNARIAVPKRFSYPMREIMQMQPRFERRRGKRAHSLLEHRRFRAAYDLFLLRVHLGEVEQEAADWWTKVQELPENKKKLEFAADKDRAKPRRRHRRPRKGT